MNEMKFEIGEIYLNQAGDKMKYVGEDGARSFFIDVNKRGYFETSNPNFKGCVDFYTHYAKNSFSKF
jgi:hypothetical protein